MCTKSSATGNVNENCSEHVLHGSYWQIKFRNPTAAEAVKTINSFNWQPILYQTLTYTQGKQYKRGCERE